MRVLIIGAGALGGYFGACLHRAGRDITFLVRPARAAKIARDGLRIVGANGDFTVPARTVLAGQIHEPYDLIFLATKSYDLEAAMEQFAPAVGPGSTILPILNGLGHIDKLIARFGAERVIGGTALISATLDAEGRIALFLPSHDLTFGELGGGSSERIRALSALFAGSGFNARASETMLQDMWEKWVGLATLAGATCLMRGSVGEIEAAPGGHEMLLALFEETRAVAAKAGFAPRPPVVAFFLSRFVGHAAAGVKSSMLRDIERGAATEGDHILGDLLRRAEGVATPILALAHTHVAVYDAARAAAGR